MSRLAPWIVVLAGGESTRLGPLDGAELSTQLAVLTGPHSLLQETVARATQLTSPDRIVVVVSAHHEAMAEVQLAPFVGVELIVQPRNLDTGPAMLLALAAIQVREPDARVAFLPSDRYIPDAQPLRDALHAAAEGSAREQVTLIGVEPDQVELGVDPLHRAGRRLLGAGATPPARQHARLLEEHRRHAMDPDARVQLEAIYDVLEPASFSWGSSRRVLDRLRGGPRHARLHPETGVDTPAMTFPLPSLS